jgi:hypothetical protein
MTKRKANRRPTNDPKAQRIRFTPEIVDLWFVAPPASPPYEPSSPTQWNPLTPNTAHHLTMQLWADQDAERLEGELIEGQHTQSPIMDDDSEWPESDYTPPTPPFVWQPPLIDLTQDD